MSGVEKGAAVEAVLALMDGHIERIGSRVDEWPEDERNLHRNGDWLSFNHRSEVVSRLRAEKIVEAVLACVLTCDRESEPQPGDGPEYHAEHLAWAERQARKATTAPAPAAPELLAGDA